MCTESGFQFELGIVKDTTPKSEHSRLSTTSRDLDNQGPYGLNTDILEVLHSPSLRIVRATRASYA